jgi:hypothetical protein
MRRILPTKFQFDYELKPYVDKVVQRKYLMEGKPLYFAKTSGTTGSKYIPLTKESMPYHIEAAAMQFCITFTKRVKLIL